MTDFDEALSDCTFPERGYTEMHRVFVLVYGDQRVILVPYTVPGDFSLEVSMFDAAGTRMVHRVMGMHSGDVLTYGDVSPDA